MKFYYGFLSYHLNWRLETCPKDQIIFYLTILMIFQVAFANKFRCFSQDSVFWVGHFNSYTNFDLKHLAQKSTFQPISCWKDESSYQKVITLFHISEKSMGSLLANFPLHYCKKTVSYLEKRGKMLKIWFQKSKNLISKSLTNMVLDRKEQLKVS